MRAADTLLTLPWEIPAEDPLDRLWIPAQSSLRSRRRELGCLYGALTSHHISENTARVTKRTLEVRENPHTDKQKDRCRHARMHTYVLKWQSREE